MKKYIPVVLAVALIGGCSSSDVDETEKAGPTQAKLPDYSPAVKDFSLAYSFALSDKDVDEKLTWAMGAGPAEGDCYWNVWSGADEAQPFFLRASAIEEPVSEFLDDRSGLMDNHEYEKQQL